MNLDLHCNHAWGGPTTAGIIKQYPQDFRVEEISTIDFSDAGEHLYLFIEKINLTTEQLCQQLADLINKPSKVVSYAGLKDKHAITHQWLSIHCPGEDVSSLIPDNFEGGRILSRRRHHKKLKIGWLQGNRFQILVRGVTRSHTLINQLEKIKVYGLPNYFGRQRFGHQGHNLYQAYQWFNGEKKVKKPFMKGMLLSAVRGFLFNQQLSLRVQQQNWRKAVRGDVMQLSGTHSIFVADELTEEIQQRIDGHDLSPCGQLVGKIRMTSHHDAYQLMSEALRPYHPLVQGLLDKKMNADWRAYILKPKDFNWHWLSDNQIMLTFELPAGSYATTILSELIQIPE